MIEPKRATAVVLLAVLAATALYLPPRASAAPGGTRSEIIDNLYGTSFVDQRTGWVVGAFGMIARSRDGGQSWQVQNSGTLDNLFDVSFIDSVNGWAVGRAGLILRTRDAGESWQKQVSGTEQHLFSVAAISPQRAVAVGDWGSILVTDDGGQTWSRRSIDRDVILNAQSWADAEHGCIVGEAGTVLMTTDGGATWEDRPAGTEKTLFGVFFRSVQEGWLVGLDGMILRTRDAGASWETLRGDTEIGALDQVGAKAGVDNPSLYDIEVRGQVGYAVGEGGAVFASADGGTTWHRKVVPAAANLRWIRAVSLVPGTHGMLVGANGLRLRAAEGQLTLPQD